MPRALVIDDDQYTREVLRRLLGKMHIEVALGASLAEGLEAAQAGEFDLVFLDVNFPDGNGLDRLSDFLAIPSSPEIIILTGEGDPDSAERALYSGAWDYIQKPVNAATLRDAVEQALSYRQQYQRFSGTLSDTGTSIIGQSARIKYCTSLLLQAAATDANCLILGETGTGKEVFARAIHANSARARSNFVIIDCTNIPQTLAESIFFGHHKGAFTDARESREGLFTLSNGGTLFLDEIGDLPLATQKSLLRVLQEKRFRPIGAKSEISSDFRVIAATNCDLLGMVAAGTFRKDLYYRLGTIVIPLPPLRERAEDIELLMRHFLEKIIEERGLSRKDFSPRLLEAAKHYPWLGNVRELMNSVNTAVTHAGDSPVLDIYHMPLAFRVQMKKMSLTEKKAEPASVPAVSHVEMAVRAADGFPTLKQVRRRAVDEVESVYVGLLVEQANGDPKKACELSGLSRARLYELLKKYNVPLR